MAQTRIEWRQQFFDLLRLQDLRSPLALRTLTDKGNGVLPLFEPLITNGMVKPGKEIPNSLVDGGSVACRIADGAGP
jgi:hypothetical protein